MLRFVWRRPVPAAGGFFLTSSSLLGILNGEGISSEGDDNLDDEDREVRLSGKSSPYDDPSNRSPGELAQLYLNRDSLDWRQRLSLMWRSDPYNRISPELSSVVTMAMSTGLVGAIIGSIMDSRKEYARFIAEHKHEIFSTPFEAQSKLQDRMALSMIQGGFRLGWRMCLLTFVFMSVGTSLAVMRNAVNPLDYLVAGATMGAVYRLQGGPRGIASGGAVGAVLGFSGGCGFWILQRLSGETVSERWLREFRHVETMQAIKDKELAKSHQEIIRRVVIDEEEQNTPKELSRVEQTGISLLRKLYGSQSLEQSDQERK